MTLNAEQRNNVPETLWGDPTNKMFPVPDQSHFDDAVREIGNAKDPAAVKDNLTRIAKQQGYKLPESWMSDDDLISQDLETGRAKAKKKTVKA